MNKFLNIFRNRSTSLVAFITIVSILSWTVGFPFGVKQASAIALNDVSDTISDSDLSATSVTHTIQFTIAGAVSAGQEISLTFQSGIDLSVASASCGAGAGSSFASSSAQRVECVATGAGISAGAKTVTITSAINPATPGSYSIDVNVVNGTETGTAIIAIIDDVTVTASVDASFTFSITGVGSGQSINGDATTTSAGATATLLPFGTLASGTPKVLAQQLSVSTNAVNGFVVTVFQNTNLLSTTGADIDLFKDGAETATPTAWTAPLATLGNFDTYGHYGITSEDNLNADEFGGGTPLYAGNIATARQVFSHNGPADGVTTDIGRTRVGIKIQVSDLQEAADDYTNIITYIATPTF